MAVFSLLELSLSCAETECVVIALLSLACAKTWTGLWTVDCGLWTVDCGLWTMDCGLWTMDCGLWMCPRDDLNSANAAKACPFLKKTQTF